MSMESLSYSAEKDLNRFDGKHHIIANLALSGVFESEDDVRNAFSEMAE